VTHVYKSLATDNLQTLQTDRQYAANKLT